MIQIFLGDEEGQALVEYGLIIALIALVTIAVISIFGARIKNALYDRAIVELPG